MLQNSRLHFPAPKHYTCVRGSTAGARCVCAFTAPEHTAPGAPASSDTAALQDQGGRITQLRGGTQGSTAQARTSVPWPQQNQRFLI